MPYSYFGPNYSIDQSYGVLNTNTGRAGGVPNSSTASSFGGWDAAAAIGGSLISGFFGAQADAAQAKQQAKSNKMSDLFQAYREDKARQGQLQDRLKAQKDFRVYGEKYKGGREFAPVIYADPSSVTPVNPYATTTTKGKKPILTG